MAIEAAALKVVVSADTRQAEQGLKSFSGGMKSMAGQMGAVGGVLTAAIGAPLIGIGVQAVKTAASFERSMNILGQVSDATAAQMQAMSDQALQLGADTVFSANEAAEGMVELAKAGMESEDVMSAIPGVMDLAAAGQISVAEAANLAAATINTFGLEAEKTTEVADVLAAAANASSADIRDLAFGVQNAGSVFASSGQSVETLATMMALLANNGLNASDAATSLKTMTMRLTAPTDKAAKVMRQLGIAVFDADGNMRDYSDIIADMEAATQGMSDATRSAAFNTIFGADAIRSALILSEEGAAGYEAMAAAVSEQGAAAAMAQAQNRGLAGGFEQLSGSIETLFTKLALPLLPTINGWVVALTDLVNQFGALPPSVQNVALAFAGVMAAAGPLLLIVSGLIKVFASLNPWLLAITAASAALAIAWQTDMGGIQGHTATAVSAIIAQFHRLKSALALSLAEADLPSFDELFADLLAGDFSGLTAKLQAALDRLVLRLKVNFQIEAQIKNVQTQLNQALDAALAGIEVGAIKRQMDGVRDDILAGLTQSIESMDWAQGGATFAGMVNDLSAAIKRLDFSGIDWADMLQRAVLAPLGLAVNSAIAAVTWVISSDKFQPLVTAVNAAIAEIAWGDLATAFAGLGEAITRQVGLVIQDIIADIWARFPAPAAAAPAAPAAPVKGAPKVEIDWSQLVIDTTGLVEQVTRQMDAINWFSVGIGLGDAVIAWFEGQVEMAKTEIKAIGAAITAFNWVNEAIHRMRAQMLLWAVSVGTEIGLALKQVDLVGALFALQTSLRAAFVEVITGALQQIGKEIFATFEAPKVTSVADILREQGAPLDWESFIPAVDWKTFIAAVEWQSFIPAVEWAASIPTLAWNAFVTMLNWGSWVSTLSWSSFVFELGWGDWIPQLDWGDFISWLALPGGGGSGGAGGAGPQQALPPGYPPYAAGTSWFPGGMGWVGERGPELVSLPQGSRIYSNQESMAMAGAGATIIIQHVEVNNGMDIEQLAAQLARRFQQKLRL